MCLSVTRYLFVCYMVCLSITRCVFVCYMVCLSVTRCVFVCYMEHGVCLSPPASRHLREALEVENDVANENMMLHTRVRCRKREYDAAHASMMPHT